MDDFESELRTVINSRRSVATPEKQPTGLTGGVMQSVQNTQSNLRANLSSGVIQGVQDVQSRLRQALPLSQPLNRVGQEIRAGQQRLRADLNALPNQVRAGQQQLRSDLGLPNRYLPRFDDGTY